MLGQGAAIELERPPTDYLGDEGCDIDGMAAPCKKQLLLLLFNRAVTLEDHAAAVTDNLRLGRFLLEALTIIPPKSR